MLAQVIMYTSCRLPDWTELFPLHKFCCEGNIAGVRKCIQMGMSADQTDSDSWSPLHYACWYIIPIIFQFALMTSTYNVLVQFTVLIVAENNTMTEYDMQVW